MSDNIEKLLREYDGRVLGEHHPRSIGLFPIPEYPEYEAGRGMWSTALEAILTTLRYLAPATLLTLFWGQQSFLFRLLKHIDSAFRAIIFSSEEQKQQVLQWLAEAGAVRVEHLDTVWRHGWILCGVLDAALPGACAGHPPIRLSLKHAQGIAEQYLGVEPVFSRQELECNDALSKHQEWKLATYLDRIRQALAKLTPPVSKPTSQRTSPETTQFTLDYVAKGSGLKAAQLRNKMFFKIYPTTQQALDPGEITILIRGPKDTYGMTVIPPILGKAQMIRQKMLGLQSKPNYTKNALPITQGATYLRSFGKNDMNKTYFIPKTNYDIDIEVDTREDHARIGYEVNIGGKYEIFITSRGQNIVGSPFNMTASKNIIGLLESESFSLEDGEEIDIVDVKTDRKVVLRIVDFVTEKMLLRENGSLEKISEEEAKVLMRTDSYQNELSDNESRTCSVNSIRSEEITQESFKFSTAANKIIKMIRVCKVFSDIIAEKRETIIRKQKSYARPRSQQAIPDIVNSTFSDTKSNPFLISDNRDKFIIPENISVSLRMEKSKPCYDEKWNNKDKEMETDTIYNKKVKTITPDSLEKFTTLDEDQDQCEDDILTDRTSPKTNPFLHDMYAQNDVIEKDLGTFVKSEYETNNSQNEETSNLQIKIVVQGDEGDTPSPINKNPFVEPDIINLERPKTPVLKIITGEVKDREDSVYVDPSKALLSEEELGNEFINPFFIHHLQSDQIPITDFIIGAPVSLPPLIRASTPEPHMESIIMTNNQKSNNPATTQDNIIDQESSSVFSTPLHMNMIKVQESNTTENKNFALSSTFHSLDSNITDSVEILSLSNTNDNEEPYNIEDLQPGLNVTHKKDMWDSAYVSIDDNNSSPDTNNNDNTSVCETQSKQKFALTDGGYELVTNMGPAERELWQTCSELKDAPLKPLEDVKSRWEFKRPAFTPILEESDRSISTGTKDAPKSDVLLKPTEIDPVTVAFAELNDVYQEYFPISDNNSMRSSIENCELIHKDQDFIMVGRNESVDSASVMSDVKRHAEKFEGKISEVQANVTESVSVSQTLQDNLFKEYVKETKAETQFGDKTSTNIVLERKQYWDERIRQIEAKSEESKTQHKKRRLSARYLRQNDSLTKRRGKQIVKNFLGVNVDQKSIIKPVEVTDIEIVNRRIEPPSPQVSIEEAQTDLKLVEKWKKYWDTKLEPTKDETDTSCFRTKSPKNKENSLSPQMKQSTEDIIEVYQDVKDSKLKISSSPVKQELPEEVFKAFETSPKRFFGTSRKQILNKIDTFLGKPSTADDSSTDVSGASPDTGLVSSRISLYHNISQTEELPWVRRKCQSMYNISQRKDSELSVDSCEDNVITGRTTKIPLIDNCVRNLAINTDKMDRTEALKQELDTASEKSLKNKRARLTQNVYNKTFDESVFKKSEQEQTTNLQGTNIKKNKNISNQHFQKYPPIKVLRKTSMSKSEMDIFNKMTYKPQENDLEMYKSCDELPKINVKSFISLYESVSKPDLKAKSLGRKIKTNFTDLTEHYDSSSYIGAAKNSCSSHYTIPEKFKSETPSDSESTDRKQSPKCFWKDKHQDTVSTTSLEPKSIDSLDIEVFSTPDLEKQTTYMSLSDIDLEIVENTDKSTDSSPKLIEETAPTDYKSRFKLAKQFFQSLEELTDETKPKKPNECELLLMNKSTESLANESPRKTGKKKTKSNSMPSSEISKIWKQLQESQINSDGNKLVKISEKFNVEDLFSDVMEGKLSRQGSLRGIPHKKAVLEAFRSMENLNSKVSSYEMAVSQLNDFAKENRIKNAQTYLSEYPYLPTTDPSKYHSRLDANASGLITLKEIKNQRPRRNSVPDLRLNTTFTVDL